MIQKRRSLRLCCWLCVVTVAAAAGAQAVLFMSVSRAAEPQPAVTKPAAKEAAEQAPSEKPEGAANQADKKPAQGKDAKATDFIRLQRDDGRVTGMQTAVIRYIKPGPDGKPLWSVDLIGAVHVGDPAYYRKLNRTFKKYDAVLYELVAPEDHRIPDRSQGSAHPIGMLQGGMSEVLDLVHQLDHIDYKKKNFVHADMSPEQFSKSMKDRGESMLSLMFRAMGYSLAEQSRNGGAGPNELALLAALFDKNRPLALKRVMAEQMQSLDGVMGMFDGPEGSTIITERNKVALDVLKEQVEAGHKQLGIFYGAGHFPDMERRLLNDFGLERGETTWLTAWDMRDPDASKKPAKQSE